MASPCPFHALPVLVPHRPPKLVVPWATTASQPSLFHRCRYEEAAALGTVAGANAALGALGREPLVIGRDQGYIGVLVDDLVTRGTQEPYRMFTSRAEYRLLLRADNADSRLTELGYRAGIVGEARHEVLQRKESAIDQGMRSLQSFALTNAEWAGLGLQVKPNGDKRTAEAVLSVPNAELEVSSH